MNLDDLIPAPSSKKVAEVANRTFGYTLDMDKLTQTKAVKLRESFAGKLAHLEKKLGARIANNRSYLENKIFLEAIDKFIKEGHGMKGMVCKDCGCKFDHPKPGCDCSHDGHKSSGSHWIKALDLDESKSSGDSWNESVISEGMLGNSELVLAAKDMVDKIQGMVEDLGEMQNEQLGPLTDAIRDEMGTEVADMFKASMEQVIVGALEGMRMSRDAADQASRILQGETPAPAMGAEMPAEEPAMEPTTDMDMEQPAPEEDFAAADAAQAGDEELGRERRA